MNRRQIQSVAALLLAATFCVGTGCDDDDPVAKGPMVMRPVEPQPRPRPTTEPAVAPATQPGDATDPVEVTARVEQPAFITITDDEGESVTYEFPPARLYLKAEPAEAGDVEGGPRVRALVYSDDPPEALRSDWKKHSFYFEMDLALPVATSDAVAAKLAEGEPVGPRDLDYAEWSYTAPSGKKSDGPSGIFLNTGGGTGGGELQLQPGDVLVTFNPLYDGFVDITLVGDFHAFDADGYATVAQRTIRVRAILAAEPVKR